MSARFSCRRILAVLALAGLAGCAGASAFVLPMPSAEALIAEAALQQASPPPRSPEPPRGTYAVLRELDRRVADVAYRLASANTELCRVVTPQIGLTIHTLAQYGADVRPEAEAAIGASGAPAVLTVAQGSPAALAGVRADDVLISINGRPFGAAPTSARPRYDETLAAQTLLAGSLAPGGPAALTVRRGGQNLTFTIAPTRVCLYDIQIETEAPPGYAAADKDNVFLSDRRIAYSRDDDELAILLSHELAHFFLGHAESLSGQALGVRVTAEREADYLGLYLAARAGYDVNKAAPYWRRLAVDFPDTPLQGLTHPPKIERIVSLGLAAAEIATKRRSGGPLLPNRRVP